MDCLFCKIAAGEIPSDRVYEDEHVIWPSGTSSPRPRSTCWWSRASTSPPCGSSRIAEGTAGRLLAAAARVAREAGLERGWRLIANTRAEGGQEVDHLHLHVLGGRPLGRMLP